MSTALPIIVGVQSMAKISIYIPLHVTSHLMLRFTVVMQIADIETCGYYNK